MSSNRISMDHSSSNPTDEDLFMTYLPLMRGEGEIRNVTRLALAAAKLVELHRKLMVKGTLDHTALTAMRNEYRKGRRSST